MLSFRKYCENRFLSNHIQDFDKLANMDGASKFNLDFGLEWRGNELGLNLNKSDVSINLANKLITVNEPDYEYNPWTVGKLRALTSNPGISGFQVKLPTGETTTLADLSKRIKTRAIQSPTWARVKYNHRSSLKKYATPIIKEIWDRNFYHATYKKHLEFIESKGLKPSDNFNTISKKLGKSSLSFDDMDVGGWSASFNPDKQHAVYLYLDKKSAMGLAKYLADRNGETAVVLEIDGHALKDYNKLVADEDALRDYWGGLEKHYHSNVPHFYGSAMTIRTIAYKGTIQPQYIKVIEEYEPDEPDEDNDLD